MIKIEKQMTYGWEEAIRGMRNPMNSWEKSDSEIYEGGVFEFTVGPNDLDLMTRLRNAGTDHRKFMRMITVYLDITAPLYWWKEFDTYKVGTVANSCSTMHKIHAKPIELSDFSFEDIVAKSRTLKTRVRNFCFIEFIVESNDNMDCALNNFTILYNIGRKNKGVR